MIQPESSVGGSEVGVLALMIAGLYTPGIVWNAFQNRRLGVLTAIPGVAKLSRIGATAVESVHLGVTDESMTVSWSPTVVTALRKQSCSVSGPEARLLLRRILGLMNRQTGSTADLGRAIERLEGTPMDRWIHSHASASVGFTEMPTTYRLRILATSWRSPSTPFHHAGYNDRSFLLMSLPRADRLAIEMWLSEDDEARALGGELALLERQWKEAEELAAIADGLVVAAESAASA